MGIIRSIIPLDRIIIQVISSGSGRTEPAIPGVSVSAKNCTTNDAALILRRSQSLWRGGRSDTL